MSAIAPTPLCALTPTVATVLVVDRSPESDAYVQALAIDWHVVHAGLGADALRLGRESCPQLIVVDVTTPEDKGFDTARALHGDAQLAHVPIVFLADAENREAHIFGLGLGAADIITKPIDVHVLRLRIFNILEREHLRTTALVCKQELQTALAEKASALNLLESLFNASSNALIVTDSHFTVVKTNPLAAAYFDGSEQPAVGGSMSRLAFTDANGHCIPLEVLAESTEVVECVVRLPPGNTLSLELRARPVSGNNGEPLHLFILHDISTRIALEKERQSAIQDMLQKAAELGVQKHAIDSHALVSITDANHVITYVNSKFCAVSGYSTDELIGRPHNMLKSSVHSPSFYKDLVETIRNGQSWQGEIANRAKDGRIFWLEMTIVPWVVDHGVPQQYVAISTDITDRRSAEEQLQLARTRELEIGAEIQGRLLFGAPPQKFAGLSIASFSEPSQGIDGDFYTFTKLNNSTIEVLTGDVMGKGIKAALIAAGVKSAYRRAFVEMVCGGGLRKTPTPSEIVNALNEATYSELCELGAFVTLTLARFDRRAGTVTWVNAGHTPMLVGRSASYTVEELPEGNLPIGVIPNERYEEHVTQIGVGDIVMLYSDGISDSTNSDGEAYGDWPVKEILRLALINEASPSITLNSLRSDLHNFTRATTGGDDRTALVIQSRHQRTERRGHVSDRRRPVYLDLPRRLDRLESLRHHIDGLCADQPEDFRQSLALAAFEAATNIVRHTPRNLKETPFTAVLRRTAEAASVELVSEGEPFVPDGTPTPDFTGNTFGGFGLYIIENCVDKVEYKAPMPGMASIVLTKQFPTPGYHSRN